jgi:long-chain fatty acid transport protein
LIRLSNLLSLLLVSLLARDAAATGFMVARFGGEQGTPVSANPTAIYFNPAGIARSRGTRVYVEGFFVYRSLSFDRDPAGIDHPNMTPGTPDVTANSGKASLGNILASPFVGVTSDLGVDKLGLGLGFYVPFGGTASWPKVDKWKGNAMYPGAQDGPQRWQDIEGEIKSTYVTAAAAYQLPANLSVGLGVNLVMSNVNDLRAANADGRDDLVGEGGSVLEGRALLDVTHTTASLGVGLQWQPIEALTVGLSYQSQPGFGEMKYKGTLRKQLGPGNTTMSDVEVRQQLPDIIRLGAAWRAASKVELRLWGSFERWSVFKDQCILDDKAATKSCAFNADGTGGQGVLNNIPRHWKNAMEVRASGSYFLSPSVELQLGAGFDGDAVPDTTMDSSLPDFNNVSVAAGAVFGLMNNKLHLTAGYFAVIALAKTIDPRARTTGGDTASPYEPPSRFPDNAGKYSELIGVLQVGVDYKF